MTFSSPATILEQWSNSQHLVNFLGPVMPSPFLYAELLSNIRQVTLYASLESHRNEETKIQLSSDRKSVSLSHAGDLVTILLPSEIAGTAQLTIPGHRPKELSFRLQIAEAVEPTRTITPSDNEVPWSANTLREAAQIKCRACENQIIDPFTIHSWKDLPSEHWAEMMDFWHCHKPHDHGNYGQEDDTGKGYAASTKVTAEAGVGLVDISSFLLAEEDCHGVQISSTRTFNGSAVVECRTCQSMLGTADNQTQGWKLKKWNLAILPSPGKAWETTSPSSVISAQLLALIDAQAVRKFVVHQGKDDIGGSAFILWVFNPDLRYSSSVKPAKIERAMKIFYRSTADAEALLKHGCLEYEELCLPSHILAQFHDALRRSSNLLPASARKFKEWEVGLIDRFSGS